MGVVVQAEEAEGAVVKRLESVLYDKRAEGSGCVELKETVLYEEFDVVQVMEIV